MNGTAELLEAAQRGDQEACEEMIRENAGLIWSIVRRYYGRGAEPEDLYQLGCLGFLKAIRGFDLQYGTQFSTYAVPKIAGEIRRFLRDNGPVKVGRGLREQAMQILSARERLAHDLGRDLGCGGTLAALRRTWAAGFGLAQCVTLDEVQQAADAGRLAQLLLPVERVFDCLPPVRLAAKEAHLFQNGVRLELGRVGVSAPEGARLAAYGPDGRFLAVAQAAEGQLRLVKRFLLDD